MAYEHVDPKPYIYIKICARGVNLFGRFEPKMPGRLKLPEPPVVASKNRPQTFQAAGGSSSRCNENVEASEREPQIVDPYSVLARFRVKVAPRSLRATGGSIKKSA